MAQNRQLAAIMFTDIEGYTALMQQDESIAISIRNAHRKTFDQAIAAHQGRIINYYGDGTLSIFQSVVHAISCAVEMQHKFRKENIPVRIGIHVGDIVLTADDIIGDSVNLASRVESLAIAGSIMISEKVYTEIKNHRSISTQFIGEFHFKNDDKPRKIFAINDPGLIVPVGSELSGKTVIKDKAKGSPFDKDAGKKWTILKPYYLVIILGVAVIGYFSYRFISHQSSVMWAKTEGISQLEEYLEMSGLEQKWDAFNLIEKLKEYLPSDSLILQYEQKLTFRAKVISHPPGAKVYGKAYNDSIGEWKYCGTTPLDSFLLPNGFSKIKLELDGFETKEDILFKYRRQIETTLHSSAEMPEGMVYIDKGKPRISLVGYDHLPPQEIEDFWIDKYEVTNKEYKNFVDAGGYRDKKFWTHLFLKEGKTIPWNTAMNEFKDKSGVNGPAGWEAGSYPDGQQDYPVSGISWYEACAYANFVGKQLPTFYHWNAVAFTPLSGSVVPMSNMKNNVPWKVGQSKAVNLGGTYDLAGNVREWIYNQLGTNEARYILGGGWDDQAYAFTDPYSLPSFSRLEANGMRCIIPLNKNNWDSLSIEIPNPTRDFMKEKPIEARTLELLIRQYDYDQENLEIQVEQSDSTNEYWIKQKILVDAAYGDEKLPVHLYLPKNVPPPYQTVVYFPGDGGFYSPSSSSLGPPDFHLKSGRAVAIPIFKGIYERQDDMRSSIPNMTNQYKEHVIMWSKDLRRTVDFLAQREDIDINNLAYFGYSWGGRMGPIMMYIEDRFKAGILSVAGLRSQKSLPEVDPFNFTPLVKIPVIMLNGEYDFYFPVESSQRPLFLNLGTPKKDKEWKIYEGSHHVPREHLVRESILWLDKYLGPVSFK